MSVAQTIGAKHDRDRLQQATVFLWRFCDGGLKDGERQRRSASA
jgi:hypothetical protein